MTQTVEERKRQLLGVSALNREVLQLEIGHWELRTARWQARASTAQKYWSVVSPLVQLFVPAKYASMLGVARAFFNFRK